MVRTVTRVGYGLYLQNNTGKHNSQRKENTPCDGKLVSNMPISGYLAFSASD